MGFCDVEQSGEQLVIRPRLLTAGMPLLLCLFLLCGAAFGTYLLLDNWGANGAVLTQPAFWAYAVAVLVAAGAALAAFLHALRPLIIDRQQQELQIGSHRESLAGALAVFVVTESSSDSGDVYHIEIALPDRRVRVGRWCWAAESNKELSTRTAARIGRFLGITAEPQAA